MREVMCSRALLTRLKHNGYFCAGALLGLWLALVAVPMEEDAVPPCSPLETTPTVDEYEPVHAVRQMDAGGAARSLTRPRYYSTELGMRAPLLAAVLTSEHGLESHGAALNATLRALQPSLRLFAATGTRPSAPRPNVVGFTDARAPLTPFHALKYLADNHLDDYHFFFLVTDDSYVNARRLLQLVSRLSVSRDVHMGLASDGGQYCALEHGVLISRGVLRAVHGALDWCVRNAYSPQHHENVGRCILHATQVPCHSTAQGETYRTASLQPGDKLTPSLADAVTVHSVTEPEHFHQLHAYVSRVHLQRARDEARSLRASLRSLRPRHPPGFRNATWPPGLRGDVGLAPPAPATRWDHARWTPFDGRVALMPDDHKAVGALSNVTKQAVDLVVREARAWAVRRWGALDAALVEGAWRWEPPTALRYRLLMRLTLPGANGGPTYTVRQLEVGRPVGAARLVSVPYVTESARVRLALPVLAAHAHVERGRAFLRRYIENGARNENTALIIVIVYDGSSLTPEDESSVSTLRDDVTAHKARKPDAMLEMVEAAADGDVTRVALAAAAKRAPAHGLMLLVAADVDYNEDFLNRVRMNTIEGSQWYLPVPFARYALYEHPRFVGPDGNRPAQRTGRFNERHRDVLAVYRSDLDHALSQCGANPSLSAAALTACGGLRALRAPEPGLLRAPPPPVCPGDGGAGDPCLLAARARLPELDLGAPPDLAKLLLQANA